MVDRLELTFTKNVHLCIDNITPYVLPLNRTPPQRTERTNMNPLEAYLEQYFDELTPIEFYRLVFPAGELEKKGEYITGMYNGIACEICKEKKPNGKPLVKRYTITDDLDTIRQLTESDNFCITSPISYIGKERTAEHARHLYAIAIDLDRIRIIDGKPTGLMNLWEGHIKLEQRIPKPSMIVSSGSGVHLYYLLDTPIALYQDTAKQLQRLKNELTYLIWGYGIVDISNINEVQIESLYQGFRMPGTVTKSGARARAFLTGGKVSIEYLNSFVKTGSRLKKYKEKKKLSLDTAREKYPEWYERRIEQKQPAGVWHISRNLYDWWKREILTNGKVGHRYWCMMTLSVYAYKCGMYDEKKNPNPVTYEELEQDCFEIMEHFETMTVSEDNHFTLADVQDALEAYNAKWIRYPRDSIEYRCGFPLPDNHRNYRKQTDHLKRARAVQVVDYPNGEWRGRKPKQETVVLWQANHPNGIKAECHRETGLSRTTIDKYWKENTNHEQTGTNSIL